MKKFSIFSILMVLFLCVSCSNLNNRNENGSIEFTTPQLPLNNISGAPVLPGIDSYFEVTITNIKNPNNQTHFVMDQNENQFVELAPGKYSVYIFGHTDDCEYEWQSEDKNPVVVKKNKITAVSAKMWEKDPEYWFEQEPGKYLPINDNIAPMYSGSLKTGEEVFLFWVNLDNAEDTIKPGEEIKTKISKRFIPHIVKTEPLMLVFAQNVFSISSTAQNVKLEYTASADCTVKYLVNPAKAPEALDAFNDALVYSDKDGITVSSGDTMTIYVIAIPLDTDLTHSTSEIIKLTFKKSYNKSVTFTVPEIKAEDSKLKIRIDYKVAVDKITQSFSIINKDDYDLNKFVWIEENSSEIKTTEPKVVIEFSEGKSTEYNNIITFMAGDKNGNYDFLTYYDTIKVNDISDNQSYGFTEKEDGSLSLYHYFPTDIVNNCSYFLDEQDYETIKIEDLSYETDLSKNVICIFEDGYNQNHEKVFNIYKKTIKEILDNL